MKSSMKQKFDIVLFLKSFTIYGEQIYKNVIQEKLYNSMRLT